MKAHRVRARATILALVLAIPAARAAAEAGQSWEWTFLVTADPAPVRARPDPTAPQIEALAKGAKIKSYSAEGAWIRVILARRDGSVVIGYAAAGDLELVDSTMNESAIYWTPHGDGYRGRRLALRLSAGFGTSGGGDVVAGSREIFWAMAAQLESLGFRSTRGDRLAIPVRRSINGEILYRLSPRFEVGLGASTASSQGSGEIDFTARNRALAEPKIKALTAFATASYLLPINRSASLRLSGGPLLGQVRFSIKGNFPASAARLNIEQAARAVGFGAQAGAALEINLDARKAFFIEVSGRGGLVWGFEGSEDSLLMVDDWMEDIRHIDGPLRAMERANITRLMVLSAPSQAPGPFRDAVYSLAGIDVRAGFRVRI